MQIEESRNEGGKVTLSLKRHAFPEGGIRAHRHYAQFIRCGSGYGQELPRPQLLPATRDFDGAVASGL